MPALAIEITIIVIANVSYQIKGVKVINSCTSNRPSSNSVAKPCLYDAYWILSRHAAWTMGVISIGLNHTALGVKGINKLRVFNWALDSRSIPNKRDTLARALR